MSQYELAYISDMKRERLTLPAGIAIFRAGQDQDNVSAARLVPAGAMAARHHEATHQADAPDMTLDTTGLGNQLHGLRVGVADVQPILNGQGFGHPSVQLPVPSRETARIQGSFPTDPGAAPRSRSRSRSQLMPAVLRSRTSVSYTHLTLPTILRV